jgi:hypothetical protein
MTLLLLEINLAYLKAKAIPVTGRGRLSGCEVIRIPHCLNNLLTDGGKLVSLAHRHHFSASGTHFCQRISEAQCLLRPEGLAKLKKLIHLIWSRTRVLPLVAWYLYHHVIACPQFVLRSFGVDTECPPFFQSTFQPSSVLSKRLNWTTLNLIISCARLPSDLPPSTDSLF